VLLENPTTHEEQGLSREEYARYVQENIMLKFDAQMDEYEAQLEQQLKAERVTPLKRCTRCKVRERRVVSYRIVSYRD